MLEKAISDNGSRIDYKDMTKSLQQNLSKLQLKMKEKNLPVIIVFEGWGASGKGSLIADIIKMLDPRFFNVYSTLPGTETDRRYPLMKRFWENIPAKGKMAIMDRSWYQELAIARLEEGISEEEYDRRIESVNVFERQLTDDGYLIIKLFLHISRQEQKRRFIKLREDNSTKWRVTDTDKMRNKNYDTYYKQFDDMLKRTDTEYCHWRVIDTTDKQFTRFQLFNILVSQITNAVNSEPHYPIPADVTTMFPMQKTPLLSEVPLENKVLKPSKYPEELKKCQKQLAKLHGKIYKKKIPVVIAFEGWDAAGKGGAIKRLGAAFDPRGYEAVPVAAPEKYELNRHYLWRFWRKLPKTGHITIFDRTWYGRVMVEKLEGLTPEARCAMAYREIDEFERELTRSGVILIKFWMQIDKDEQLKRFNERMENPEKQWKITDEDWRNREKWDLYETAVNEMLEKTSTVYAPWTIVESNDKLYARIKVMNTVIDRLEEALKK
ncbi:MAG: polyphosphate:AMP phosphotransferase [Oscillospiraceae bacterium]|nr:polyphosphate:AMP phosphotransferase [Oscillospiraceae bacterium]